MGWLRRLLRRPPLLHVAGDVGAGPPVVLLHGIASSSVTFENVVPLIADRHRAISIDLLGFGSSPAPADASYSIEEHVAALRHTVRTIGLREFVLVGHSMGALIATRYAANHRRQVTRLVIVSPPVYITPTEIAAPFDRAAMGDTCTSTNSCGPTRSSRSAPPRASRGCRRSRTCWMSPRRTGTRSCCRSKSRSNRRPW